MAGLLLTWLALAATACGPSRQPVETAASGKPTRPASSIPSPAPGATVPREPRSGLAVWPMPGMRTEVLRPGMTKFTARDPHDGTQVVMLKFDSHADPRLRLELYDADEDDEAPNDDRVTDARARDLSALWVMDHLKPRGDILAVINGPFFAAPQGAFVHTAAVVRDGKVYANVANPRWAFGVKQGASGPKFALVHRPQRRDLRAFDWGAGNVQALVVGGRPTTLPTPGDAVPNATSPPSIDGDCGPYPYIDYLKTARTCVGWREHEFALLVVLQAPPDDEMTALQSRAAGERERSGWDIADMQQFWTAWGAVGACNLDGGLSTQLAWRDRDVTRSSPEDVRWRNDNADHDLDASERRARVTPVLLYPYVRDR